MRLIRRLRRDERGSALVIAIMTTAVLLALGLALLAIVDTQATESASDRTRDRTFNLSESVLNSEAFVLGRSWPATMPSPNSTCGTAGMGFMDTLGTAAGGDARSALLRPNLNASYTDASYSGATWQVNVCDDSGGSTVWNNQLLTTQKAYDSNANNMVWVRAQATVGSVTRAITGLVRVRTSNAVNSKYGLVAGNVSDDLGPVTSALTSAPLVTAVTSSLLNPASPPVLADPAYPVPASGVTGVRCGLLDNVLAVKTCVTGAIGALSQVPLVNTLVGQSKFEQFPSVSSTSPTTIGQLRTQAKTSPGVYMATAPGATLPDSAPSCAITGAASDSVVFIEKVGTGDQYCYVSVSSSVTYKALVIGSGRVIIRGNNAITTYATAGTNRFTGVVYALNNQSSAAEQASANSPKELIHVEKGARVTGAVHADGKNATIGLIAPDFDTNALINGLLCPGLLCAVVAPTLTGLLGTLGVSGVVNALINGQCLVTLPILGCTVSLPGLGLNTVVGGITAQLSTYGSAIHSDVATINNLKVYGTSGVVSGSFRDLQQR